MPTIDAQAGLAHLSRKDRTMRQLIRTHGDFNLAPYAGTIFDGLTKSIVYQQLSGKAAGTIHRRLLERLPRKATDRPRGLLDLSDDEIRAAGISRGKLLSLRDLAQRTVDGRLPDRRHLRPLTDDEIVERLTEVRGVGRWTAEMILIFWLGRLDVLPALDLGVRRGFAMSYGHPELPEPKALLEFGQRWSPYRSIAAWYLWRAADQDAGDDSWND
jgi:3-methyladenine DNA glycosylase/8-oxoguanine DNA glycosylase